MTGQAPRCFNRPPGDPVTVRHGIDQQTGEAIRVEIRHDWCKPGCKTHEGRGIGQNGENYAEAHGWLPWCARCRWNPARDTEPASTGTASPEIVNQSV